jgi:hypothetical protein
MAIAVFKLPPLKNVGFRQTSWEFLSQRENLSALLAVAALVFAGRQFLDAREHKKAIKEVVGSLQEAEAEFQKNIAGVAVAVGTVQQEADKLGDVSRDISEAVRTVPPGQFVGEFCRHVTAIYTKMLPYFTPDMPPAALEALIRRLLSAIALLAHVYDARKARYAANVMIFIPRENSPPYFPGLDEGQIRRFIPPPLGLDCLEGLLVLIEDLSVVAQPDGSPDAAKDDSLEPVFFGIPNPCREGLRWNVLPGAPLAYAKWNHQIQSSEALRQSAALRDAVQGLDDLRMIRQCNREGVNGEEFDISDHVLKALDSYYREHKFGRKVKSFQSFPLIASPDGRAFGALNVHCDQATFLGPAGPQDAARRQQIFAGIVTPIVFQIASATLRWWELARDKHRAAR